MRKSTIIVALILLTSAAVIGAQPQARKAKEKAKDRPKGTIEGTWQRPIENQPNLNQVKIIHQGHFLWITYDRETRISQSGAGGSYTLQGRNYKERVLFGRFGTPELQENVGDEQAFQVTVNGDRMVQWGTMSNGQEIHEIWQRVK